MRQSVSHSGIGRAGRRALGGAWLVGALLALGCGPPRSPEITVGVGAGRQHHALSGTATWYGPGLNGNRTANGERFNMNHMTAAHRSLPFHSRVRVTDLDTGRAVVVRINDRGPFGDGIIDLSKAAGRRLGILRKGRARVQLTVQRWGKGGRR